MPRSMSEKSTTTMLRAWPTAVFCVAFQNADRTEIFFFLRLLSMYYYRNMHPEKCMQIVSGEPLSAK